ncbi:MAG: thiamine phosphate synthase [Alphaproteobacteria bacterium]|nr:thiamine phosphate synthase [Alphaproteobacteria bacterium]
MTPIPPLWLITDDRRGDAEAAMPRLPKGAGVIFRHYEARDREALARRLRAVARLHGLIFLVAGDPRLAARVGADGFHAPERLAHRIPAARRLLPGGLVTQAVHGAAGLHAAQQFGADAVLLSPVFATSSHPGARALGPARFAALAVRSKMPVIALGGMSGANFRRLNGSGALGFAAIEALQKPNETSVNRMSAPRSPA